MEIGVLADIHGNYIALERCLEYAFSRNIDTFFFLGDYVGELAYPERTMKMLYEVNEKYKCYFIRGNREEYFLKYRADGEMGWKDKNSASGSLLYAYKSLIPKDLDFFKQLKSVRQIALDGMEEITICHGSPDKTNEPMLENDDRTIEVINGLKTSTMLCGHTYRQGKITHNGKSILNPGSVGITRFSEGKTQFLILDGNSGIWSEEFISLDYDVDRAIREMHEVRLNEHAPYWSIITENILCGGNVSHTEVLSRAMELCRKETGDCVWPDIPEKYWDQASKEIGILK